MKILFYDVETTGVKYYENAIHQISGMIVEDGEIKEKFDFRVRPHEGAKIEQSALDVGKLTVEQVMAYPPSSEVFPEFFKLVCKYVPHRFTKGNKDRIHLSGFNNAHFDDNFLRGWMYRNGEKYFNSIFHMGSLDVMIMAAVKFASTRQDLPSFKLMDVCRYLGVPVEEEKLHDSLYDIELTQQCFNILYKELVEHDKQGAVL